MPFLSIIIPIHNELATSYIQRQVELFKKFPEIEVLFIDGGSADGTIEYLQSNGYPATIFKESNRAQRLNRGISLATGELLLLHHPRSLLNEDGLSYLLNNFAKLSWGGFTHRFDQSHLLLNFTSWYSNEVRSKIRSIIYLDHCIFFKRSFLKTTPYIPELPIFEDTALSEKLKEHSLPIILPFPSVTSSIRFNKNGLIFQSLLNQVMKLCWYFKVSPEQMNKIYEKGLELNSKV